MGPLPGTGLVVAVVVEMWEAAAGVVSDDGGGDGGDAWLWELVVLVVMAAVSTFSLWSSLTFSDGAVLKPESPVPMKWKYLSWLLSKMKQMYIFKVKKK